MDSQKRKFYLRFFKFNDTDNWSIDNETFKHIQNTFDYFPIDRFSDDINKKVMVFNSKFRCPNRVGVNADKACGTNIKIRQILQSKRSFIHLHVEIIVNLATNYT